MNKCKKFTLNTKSQLQEISEKDFWGVTTAFFVSKNVSTPELCERWPDETKGEWLNDGHLNAKAQTSADGNKSPETGTSEDNTIELKRIFLVGLGIDISDLKSFIKDAKLVEKSSLEDLEYFCVSFNDHFSTDTRSHAADLIDDKAVTTLFSELDGLETLDVRWNRIDEKAIEALEDHAYSLNVLRAQGGGKPIRLLARGHYTDDAEHVIAAERDHLLSADWQHADDRPHRRMIGLALSGGGIRSASFSLGVLQALIRYDWLKDVHYMSTVSGGGFTGSSLSWFIGSSRRFGTRKENFPFGIKEDSVEKTYEQSERAQHREGSNATPGSKGEYKISTKIFDHIRHNGSYIALRREKDFANLLTAIVRTIIPSFFIYFCMFFVPLAFVAFALDQLPEISEAQLAQLGKLDRMLVKAISFSGAWRLAGAILLALGFGAVLGAILTSAHGATTLKKGNQPPTNKIRDHVTPTAKTTLVLVSLLSVIFMTVYAYTSHPFTEIIVFSISFSIFIALSTENLDLPPLILLLFLLPLVLFFGDPERSAAFSGAFRTYSLIMIFVTCLLVRHVFGALKNSDNGILKNENVVFVFHLIFGYLLFAAIYFTRSNIHELTGIANDSFVQGIFATLAASAIYLVFLIVRYIILSLEARNFSKSSTSKPDDVDTKSYLRVSYSVRKNTHPIGARMLSVSILLLALGLASILDIFDPSDVSDLLGVGTGATLFGVLSFIGKKLIELKDTKSKLKGLESFLVYAATTATVFGLLMVAIALCEFLDFHAKVDLQYIISKISNFLILVHLNGFLDFAWLQRLPDIRADKGEMSWILNTFELLPAILVVMLLGIVVGRSSSVNLVGLHRIYRDLLMQTFMPDVQGDRLVKKGTKANEFLVHELRDATKYEKDGDRRAPYHIINTNLVIGTSDDARLDGRGGSNFILSPLFSGSSATGWRDTRNWKVPSTTMSLPTAMATSGAAFNPRTGPGGKSPARTPLISFLMTLFNARLGLWVLNPRYRTDGYGEEYESGRQQKTRGLSPRRRWKDPDFVIPGVFGKTPNKDHEGDEYKRFVELTDGAHFDNTGLYELIRRNVRLIFLVDCSEDKGFNYASLATAFERIRADFAVQFRFRESDRDLEHLLHDPESKSAWSKKLQIAQRGYALARIDYQPHGHRQRGIEDGLLVIIKSTMIKDLPADVLGYKSANPDFPDESTMDQFFDEIQFEAYRELGYRIAKKTFEDEAVKAEFDYCVSGVEQQWGRYQSPLAFT